MNIAADFFLQKKMVKKGENHEELWFLAMKWQKMIFQGEKLQKEKTEKIWLHSVKVKPGNPS